MGDEWEQFLEGWGDAAVEVADDEAKEAPVARSAVDFAPLDDGITPDEMEVEHTLAEPSNPAEVKDVKDATALLAAAKGRLERKRYQQLLTAVSGQPVDRKAALATLQGHPDLVAAFRRCFSPEASGGFGTSAPAPPAASQVVQLLFGNMLGRDEEEAKMLSYLEECSWLSKFPRRLFILRGPPGMGQESWAQEALKAELGDFAGLTAPEKLARQLSHVCSTDDFSMKLQGPLDEITYVFNPHAAEAHKVMNEARVRLCMELGVEPLYISNSHASLWEMRPYVLLAERMGYVVTVVPPADISKSWNNVDALIANAGAANKLVDKNTVLAILKDFEPLPENVDACEAVRDAKRPPKAGLSSEHPLTQLPPSAILYKFERLLKDGNELMFYTPPNGKGWGVNGELEGEWHAFREKADGSCCYHDNLEWRTEDPELGWTLPELNVLKELREQAKALPKAELPSMTTHPSLFGRGTKRAATAVQAARPVEEEVAPPAPATPPLEEASRKPQQVSRAGVWQQQAAGGAVPASRVERFKHRMRVKHEGEQMEEPEQAVLAPAKKRREATKAVQPAPTEDLGIGPTEQEEISAATFLAAVKTRLTDWGKLDQYKEFVLALSGTVDAKSAVRILRGHNDLLQVFRRKFAPEADLMAIKQELKEEDSALPRPPSYPPQSGRVKQEAGTFDTTPITPEASEYRPMPPKGPPKSKIEAKGEDVPRPPRFAPNAFRGVVTVGDDVDDEEELDDEASIATTVKKGREECIAQLAKVIFRKERASHEGMRPRLSMVRYATKRTATPRFPREMIVLRGVPGIGKTEFAMQQLADSLGFPPEEQLAVRLTHICAADDFFETFNDAGEGSTYKFNPSKLETVHRKNELRARYAMEAGVHPLYIDCTNLKLWELRPYIMVAERLGYIVSVVEPQEICERWDDLDFIAGANDTMDRRDSNKVVDRNKIAAMIDAFEPLPTEGDHVAAARQATRTAEPRLVEASETLPISKPPPGRGNAKIPRPPPPKPAMRGSAGAPRW